MSLVVSDLAFSYRCFPVLHNVTFRVGFGNLVCVLGKNGAGKSTLFRCILGLAKPTMGSVVLDGEDIALLPPSGIAQKMAYIPQRHEGNFSYTVLDMVLMSAAAGVGIFSTPGRAQEVQAMRALEHLGIESLAHRNFSHLSGGEQQMVLIARAVAQQARLLVMDEPCSGLDYGNQIRVMECAKALAQQGYLLLLSTHNPQQALSYADQALVLSGGEVKALGAPKETLDEVLLEEIYGVPVRL